INRGGMKVSPIEVDDALCSHGSVAHAVTFAVPDTAYGEEVAAAVVFRAGRTATQIDLQRHVATLLADYKVPRKIIVLQELPKGPTGKVVRIGLADRLGLTTPAAVASAASNATATASAIAASRSTIDGKPASRTKTQEMLASIWSGVLGRDL